MFIVDSAFINLTKAIDVNFRTPNINFFIELIEREQKFSAAKLNHSFWETLNGADDAKYTLVHGNECINIMLKLLREWNSDVFLGVSTMPMMCLNAGPSDLYAYYSYRSWFSCNHDLNNMVNSYTRPDITKFYGNCWRLYCINRTITRLFDFIKNHRVLVVGMAHLYDVCSNLGISNNSFYKVGLKSWSIREKVVNDIINLTDNSYNIILLQSGDLMGSYLAHELYGRLNKGCILSVGRILDIWANSIYLDPEDIEYCNEIGFNTDYLTVTAMDEARRYRGYLA